MGIRWGCISHRHTTFFVREKYRQSLAYLMQAHLLVSWVSILHYVWQIVTTRIDFYSKCGGRGAYSALHPQSHYLHLRGKRQETLERTGKGRQGRNKRGEEGSSLPYHQFGIRYCCRLHDTFLDENLQVQCCHLANDFVNNVSVKLQYRLQLQLRSSVNSSAKQRFVKHFLNVHLIQRCHCQWFIP